MRFEDFFDFSFVTIIVYGIILLIWALIPPINKTIHKKDFIRYWSVWGMLYWILSVIVYEISKILGFYNNIAEWFLLSIISCVISVIYFMVLRFFSRQEIIKQSLSKNEKIGIVIVSFIHFLISPPPSVAFFYIINRAVKFLIRSLI